jgi:hypothetical protein
MSRLYAAIPTRLLAIAPTAFAAVMILHAGVACGQSDQPLVETGHALIAGREIPYQIRNLPVNSFPEIPAAIANVLNTRGCVIPQTYEAHRPENVIHGSFERPGSVDWALLCSVKGYVSLLVFFADASPADPIVLATASNSDRLQPHDLSGELGFNWGIDPASPQRVRDAQAAMTHRPATLDHDCLADSILESKTIYHLYRNGIWENVPTD